MNIEPKDYYYSQYASKKINFIRKDMIQHRISSKDLVSKSQSSLINTIEKYRVDEPQLLDVKKTNHVRKNI
jgi:hypothetical protein